MSAPTPTAAGSPSGFKLPDGFSSKLTFASKPSVQLWIKTVKPSAYDGGEPIPTSTMHNVKWHTFAPRTLIKSDPATFTAAYDPDCLPDLLTLINRPGDVITEHWPDGSSRAAYGFLQKGEFGDLKEGEMPEMTGTVAITNTDSSGAEQGPVFTPASGT